MGAGTGPASPDSAVVAGEVRMMLQHAVSGMPEDERTVIVLAYREELTQSEIADRLGWPIGTVKTGLGARCAGFGRCSPTSWGPRRPSMKVPVPTGEGR